MRRRYEMYGLTWFRTSDLIFFFKQKTADEMRISDWSSDVCSSDLLVVSKVEDSMAELRVVRDYRAAKTSVWGIHAKNREQNFALNLLLDPDVDFVTVLGTAGRSEEHTSELQSLMRISSAVFCLKTKKMITNQST